MEIKNNLNTILENGVETFSNGHVTKRKVFNYNNLLWVALGIVALFVQLFDQENGSMTMFLLIIGISLILFGIIRLFAKKERYFYDNKPMKMRTFMFDQEHFNEVMKLYDENKFSEMLNISRSSASKMKLKVLFTTDYSVAFSQIYKFIDYDFTPMTPIRVHDKTQCNSLNTLVISY